MKENTLRAVASYLKRGKGLARVAAQQTLHGQESLQAGTG